MYTCRSSLLLSGDTGVFSVGAYHCPRSVCRDGRRMFLASTDAAESHSSYACRSTHGSGNNACVQSFERVEQQGGSESITLSENLDGCGAAPDRVRHGWARVTASE
jgi:hypothetical protein